MTVKKIISLLLVALILAASLVTVSFASPSPEIEIGSGSAAPGEAISLPVEIKNNPGISYFSISISYDSSRLRLDGLEKGEGVPGNFSYSRKVIWMSSSDVTFNGTLFNLNFTVLDNAPAGDASVSVTYNEGDIYNANEDDVNFAVKAGKVSVGSLTVPQIVVGSAEGAAGSTVHVPVEFCDNPGVSTYTLAVEYDDTRLNFTGASSNPDLGGQFIVAEKIVWVSLDETDYNGTFLTLDFSIPNGAAPGEAYVTVSYSAGDICNYNEDEVYFETVPGKVTVVAGDAPKITVGEVSGAPGEAVSVPVEFDGNPGISTFTLTFGYDTEKLSLNSVTPADELGGQFVFADRAVWVSMDEVQFDGVFLTLNFTILDGAAEGDAEITVSYSAGDICDYDENEVYFETVPGKVTVESAVLIGDVNNDGMITIRDLSELKRLLAGASEDEFNLANSDVSGDGLVTISDLSSLKKMLAG